MRRFSPDAAENDPEFDLCIACCRWPQDVAASETARAKARSVDWPRFLKILARHRVEGLAFHALQRAGVDIPSPAREALSGSTRAAALQNVAMAAECLSLHDAFRESGVPILFIKGVTLAMLAYGDLGRKKSWDIDILVSPNDLTTAASLLEARGYRLYLPKAGRSRLDAWHRLSKESCWRHPQSGHTVELHTALTDNSLGLEGVNVHSPIQWVAVGNGKALPTLASDDLFAYLAAHGASSGWFRLKWIADFAALHASLDSVEFSRLHAHAKAIGAERASALALLLADRIFGLPLAPELRGDLARERTVGRLLAHSLALMSGRRVIENVTDLWFGTIPIHRVQFGLRPEWRYKAGLLKSKILIWLF